CMPSSVGRPCTTVIGPYPTLKAYKPINIYFKLVIAFFTNAQLPVIMEKERAIGFILCIFNGMERFKGKCIRVKLIFSYDIKRILLIQILIKRDQVLCFLSRGY